MNSPFTAFQGYNESIYRHQQHAGLLHLGNNGCSIHISAESVEFHQARRQHASLQFCMETGRETTRD